MRLKGHVLAGNRATHPHNTYDHPESEVQHYLINRKIQFGILRYVPLNFGERVKVHGSC